MATVYRNKQGQWSVQYFRREKRDTIYLGRVNKQLAQEFGRHLEQILTSEKYRQPLDPRTQAWLTDLAPPLLNKLAKKDLTRSRAVSTVGELCEYCWTNADIATSTLTKYREAEASLVEFFGGDHLLHHVTPGDAREFYLWLRKKPLRGSENGEVLAETTVDTRCKQVRQFFKTATDKGWISTNPFHELRLGSSENPDRQDYVPVEIVNKLIAIASPPMQLVLACARFGGLRVMSEIKPLEWDWVDFQNGQVRIFSPKNRRFKHKAWRTIPLYPVWRPYLEAALERRPSGEKFVLHEDRELADSAWWSRLDRLCRRAEISPWSSLWHSLRGSRATDLINEGFSEHVVCDWQNDSPKMLRRHYLKTTQDDFARALDAAPPSPQETPAKLKPSWDSESGILIFGNQSKRIARQASLVREGLDMFEEKGWAEKINSPYPDNPEKHRDLCRTLRDRCRELGLSFHSPGTGTDIVWKISEIENSH